MKNTRIDFQWTQGGKTHNKLIERDKIYAIFKGLSEGYRGDNNEISAKMIKDIIPYVDVIYIDRDYNDNQDIPFISYKIDMKVTILKINRHHKIVWSILDRYCTE